MGERHPGEAELLTGVDLEQLLPGDGAFGEARPELSAAGEVGKNHDLLDRRHRPGEFGDHFAPVETTPAVVVAVDRQQDPGLDLGEAVRDRTRAEVG